MKLVELLLERTLFMDNTEYTVFAMYEGEDRESTEKWHYKTLEEALWQADRVISAARSE